MRDAATKAVERLRIPAHNRPLLTLDGGGIRGILTIQLLKALATPRDQRAPPISNWIVTRWGRSS
jgi:hypothetical protein